MSSWQFDHPHINSWAEFSGDFNPIHFDIERARQAGSDAIIVHGMLPLLHVKQAIAKHHADSASFDQGLNIKCRLKSPLQRGVAHEFSIRNSGEKGKFSIQNPERESAAVQGNFSTSFLVESGSKVATITIERDVIEQKLTQFSQLFSNIGDLWIGIDSLVFSEFLRSEIPFTMAKQLDMAGSATSQADLMTKALTIQTFHSVHVSPELLKKPIAERGYIKSIEINLGNPTALKNSDSELLGSHELDIYVNGEFVMQSEVGLMLKLN